MSMFPRMLYKVGGPHEIHGGMFAYKIVDDEDELTAAQSNGWHMTTDAARAEPVPVVAPVDEVSTDAPPTRDELKRKASELGISYPPNIPTDRLAALVAEKVKE